MDATASFQASLPLPSFVIRIQLPSGEATDWRIDSEISFHDVLVSIKNAPTPEAQPASRGNRLRKKPNRNGSSLMFHGSKP